MPISPTAEGFRVAFRRPSLTIAEIMWRWTAGGTAAALFLFGLFEYLNTLPVTNGEMLFMRTRHPYLVAEAIAHILRGTLSRVVVSSLLATLLLAMLWVLAASVGRIATVRALLDHFRNDAAFGSAAESATTQGSEPTMRALVRLNFLRAAVALSSIIGFIGAGILAGFASPNTSPHPVLAFLIFLPLAGLIFLAWSALNWLLSLAAFFAVRDGDDAVAAISSAVTLCRERTGPVSAVTTWTGLAHLVAFVAATTVVSIPLGFIPLVPWRLAVLGMIALTLAYLVVADWLYIARLAGYVCIAEAPAALLRPALATQPPMIPPSPIASLETTIDRNELILSDVPATS